MIYVYTRHQNPRIIYAIGVVFRDLMHLGYSIIDDPNQCPQNAPLIAYGECGIKQSFSIPAHGILDDTGIETIRAEFVHSKNQYLLFIDEDNRFDLDYDIFGAAFYLLSRYEEYLTEERDDHGRFRAKDSILYQQNLIKEPILDQYTHDLYGKIAARWPDYVFTKRQYKYELTFDIDMAWSYLHKGFLRNLGGIAKDFINGRFKEVLTRLQVLSCIKPDPYFCFDRINQINIDEAGEKLMFFLMAKTRNKFDKNTRVEIPAFRKLIQQQKEKTKIGLHPSYQSNSNPKKIGEELQRLSNLADMPITRSRQHYLKLEIPKTYRQLINVGIQHDYSMGYAETTGFRAGTSMPYRFYDLANEKELDFQVHPFCVMDGTLKDYMQLSPQQSEEEIMRLLRSVKSVNGTFSILLHNETLSGINRWNGWEILLTELAYQLKDPKG